MHPIVYISHRMEKVYRIADRITILRDGKNLLDLDADLLDLGGRQAGAHSLWRRCRRLRIRRPRSAGDRIVTRLPPRLSGHWQGA
jgi:ribose transport system ATP-binding protein